MSDTFPNNIRDEGAVSIFSVIFFIILTSIITIGFIRIVNIEQRQAIDNSSSANALAAARSGVEDGKRVLLLAEKLPTSDPLKATIDTVLNSPMDCDSILGNPSIVSKLNITADGKVYRDGDDGGQSYTCLTIDRDTENYINEAGVGKSVIVPLKPKSGSFSTIRFSWHDNTRDGTPTAVSGFAGNPTFTELNTKKTPSPMRLQLIKVPAGSSAKPSAITSKTGFLATSVVPVTSPPVALALNDDQNVASTSPVSALSLSTASCSMTADYACVSDVKFGAFQVGYDYYLRVSAIYRTTSFKVQMLNGAVPDTFDGVQPIVDVTGKSGDTFRRIQARVGFSPTVDLPEYVAESTGDGTSKGICKDMLIASDGHVSSTCWTP
jgi:Tfp pilus assembly protein PilX